ncbi:hypothetical protein, partial [Burkholderia multivorans]|uniref:hypothetical protein n=1 Tax=Burkholderia multivorans TaxID=87883 RepID=UPI00286FC181
EYERNSPRMSSNSYVNLKIATCLVRYADDRLIDQRFPNARHSSNTRKNARFSGFSADFLMVRIAKNAAALPILETTSRSRSGRMTRDMPGMAPEPACGFGTRRRHA